MGYGREAVGIGPRTALLAALLLALSIAIGGSSIGSALERMPTADRHIGVSGVAYRDVIADQAIWRITVSHTRTSPTQAGGAVAADIAAMQSYFTEQGFDAAEVSPEHIQIDQSVRTNTTLSQDLVITTSQVDTLTQNTRDLQDLWSSVSGRLTLHPPVYAFTQLGELETDLREESARNAKAKAQNIADQTGVSLGALRHADQSPVVVTGRDIDDQTDHADQVLKRVSVTTHASFFVHDG